jgi:hypothetical protein
MAAWPIGSDPHDEHISNWRKKQDLAIGCWHELDELAHQTLRGTMAYPDIWADEQLPCKAEFEAQKQHANIAKFDTTFWYCQRGHLAWNRRAYEHVGCWRYGQPCQGEPAVRIQTWSATAAIRLIQDARTTQLALGEK